MKESSVNIGVFVVHLIWKVLQGAKTLTRKKNQVFDKIWFVVCLFLKRA
jgi:hypothetical protein